ncbi:MAG: ABC transporter permease [Firmicutes bacterium]|nr:ABC transporter permease [Bacillota bacterium]
MHLALALISAAFGAATPIILASLGGLFTFHANTFNIAMEGMMLVGAFFAVVGSYFFHSWLAGLFLGVAAAFLVSILFAVFSVTLRCDEFVTGIAINMVALGGTTFLLRLLFNVKGAFVSDQIVALPRVHFAWLSAIPVVGPLFDGQSFLVYLSWLLVAVVSYFLYHTRFGLQLRATGEHAETAASVGINPARYKIGAALLSGVLSGLGGVYLSLGYVTLFTENMTNGRGFIALAAIILTRGSPAGVLLISLVFGFCDGLGLVLQNASIPPQFTHMLPYLATLVALYVYNANWKHKQGRAIADANA